MNMPNHLKHSATKDRRRSPRHVLNRLAQIRLGPGRQTCDCLVTDISEGGVRLHVEGFDVPDEFVLLVSADGRSPAAHTYKVVWRLGHEIGAQLAAA